MIEMINSPQPFTEKKQWTVFLAGPMSGAPAWRPKAKKEAQKLGIDNVTFLNPCKSQRHISGTLQVNWETFGLRMCDVILFWIPPQAKPIASHRIYAITTRLEMAENLARGHKMIIGVDPECEDLAGIHHLTKRMARYYGINKIHSTLEDCIKELQAWMNRPRKEEDRIHHIPGPMFEPMYKLSQVVKPNTCRNQTLMEHWNQTVAPGDTVYVEGEFGAEEWLKFLNGRIEFKEK